ncbi:MAG: MFS transporter, partial [Spirochaetes bacterium]
MMDNQLPERFTLQIKYILFVTGVVFFNMLSRYVFSPLLLEVERSFNISHAVASRFFLYISIGYAIAMLCSGYVSTVINHRGTIILSSAMVGVTVILVALSSSLPLIYTGLFLLGMGSGFYAPSGISVITSMVVRDDWGKALAVHEIGPNLSLVAAPLMANLFIRFTSWRGVLIAIGMLSLLMAYLFFRFNRGGNFPGQPLNLSNIIPLLKKPSFWLLMLFFCFALGGVQGVYSLLPAFLVTEKGFEAVYANNLFGISRIICIVAIFFSGFLVDRIGIKKTIFLILLCSGAAILLLAISSGAILLIMIFLQPAIIALFFPAGLAALSSIGPPQTRNLVVSLIIP